MPIDVNDFLAPHETAVVTCEMQRGTIGDLAFVPGLPEAAAEVGIVEHGARLVRGARAAGVRVLHATVGIRADRAGITVNNRMMAFSTREPLGMLDGSPPAELIPELGPEPDDLVVHRIHGLTPFTGTELDAILRNLGIRTIVPVGVSVNEALLGLCISAADLGYRIALPTDAIAGVPRSYAEDVVRNTLAFLSNLTTTEKVIAAWEA